MKNCLVRELKETAAQRKIDLLCMTVSVCIYILNKAVFISITEGWINYFSRNHLNDLVCPLFFLGYCQIWLSWAGYKAMDYRHMVIYGMAGGFIWEYFAPFINPRSVSDLLDLACYFAGIHIYYAIVKADFCK